MANDVSIGGWDMAVAMRYGDINARIAKKIEAERAQAKAAGTAPSFPENVNVQSQSVISGNISVSASGVKPWGLTRGGQGEDVVIGVVLSNASVAIGAKTLTGVEIRIGVKLKIVNSGGDIALAQRDSLGLADISYASGTLQDTEKNVLSTALGKWLEGLMPQFSVALTGIDAAIQPANPDWGWLTPKIWSGRVVEFQGGNIDDSLFVVASMSTGTTPPSSIEVSGEIIPQGASVGIAINPSVMLQHMIVPGLPLLFDQAVEGDFTVSGSQVTTNKTFEIKKFKVKPDEPETPVQFRNFKAWIEAGRIKIQSDMSFDYHDVSLTTTFGATMELFLDSKDAQVADGTTQPVKFVNHRTTLAEAIGTTVTGKPGLTGAIIALGIGTLLLAAVAAFLGARYSAEEPAPEPGEETVSGDTASVSMTDVSVPGDSTDATDPTPDVDSAIESRVGGEEANLAFNQTCIYWTKVAGFTLLGVMAGGGLTAIPTLMLWAQGGAAEEFVPEIDKFLQQGLKALDLPGGGAEDYEMVSLGLDGALVIGANLKAG